MKELTPEARKELLIGLGALQEDARLANAKIEYSYSIERMQRRIRELEERIETLENFIASFRQTLK